MKKQLIKMCLLLGMVLMSVLLSSCIGNKVNERVPPKAVIPSIPTCKTCKGEFEVICPKCLGMKEVTCLKCAGLRGKRINCPACNHGKIKTFFGKEKDCEKCKGKGIITEYCSKCSGKGRVNCEQCGGTGKIECPECAPKPKK